MAKSFKEIGKKAETLIEQGKEADQKVQACQMRVSAASQRVVSARSQLAAASETDEDGQSKGDVEHARAQLNMAQNQLAASQRSLSSAHGQANNVRQDKSAQVREIDQHNKTERVNLKKLQKLHSRAFGEASAAVSRGMAERLNEAEDYRAALLESMDMEATVDYAPIEHDGVSGSEWTGGSFAALDLTGQVQNFHGGGSSGTMKPSGGEGSIGISTPIGGALQGVTADGPVRMEGSEQSDFNDNRKVGTLQEPEKNTENPVYRDANSTYKMDGIKYKTDDNGNTYMKDNELLQNTEYEINGYKYRTDEQGRTISAEGTLHLKDPNRAKKPINEKNIGGKDKRDTDHRGHMIADLFDGSNGIGNLIAMDANLNSGEYKALEYKLAQSIKEHKIVKMKVEPIYEVDSKRPSEIIVEYTIDCEKTVIVFLNESADKKSYGGTYK